MKYFVVSDTHSYFTLLQQALVEAGFDINNDSHKIILCGDAFDRGLESVAMLDWLKDMLSKEKLIYIRGNHEDLFKEMVLRHGFAYHDYSNGTVQTLIDLFPDEHGAWEKCQAALDSGIIDFIDQHALDFYETDHYIFTHGYLPTNIHRAQATKKQWEQARWQNGVNLFMNNEKRVFNKTLVVGHWHCNWWRDTHNKELEAWTDFSIEHLQNKQADSIYAIDACTAYSKKINVLVLED